MTWQLQCLSILVFLKHLGCVSVISTMLLSNEDDAFYLIAYPARSCVP
jgi:hypothetical protein